MIRRPRHPRGLTLLEALLLVTILSIVALGFGIGLQANARVPGAVDRRLAIHTRLVEKLEELSTVSFDTLAANTTLSDTITLNNQALSRTVAVSKVDADGINGPDSDLLEIQVTIGSQSLKTRIAQR